MRAFIAIELPEPIRQSLDTLSRRLRGPGPKVSWVRAENIHLTLRFLGDITGAQAAELIEKVAGPCAAFSPFTLRVRGAGAFPNLRKPNVIWVGCEPVEGPLGEVQALMERAACALGLSPETKAFRPHLTLGRVRDTARVELLTERLAAENTFDAGDFTVRGVSLFSSELRPSGPRYQCLKEFAFASV